MDLSVGLRTDNGFSSNLPLNRKLENHLGTGEPFGNWSVGPDRDRDRGLAKNREFGIEVLIIELDLSVGLRTDNGFSSNLPLNRKLENHLGTSEPFGNRSVGPDRDQARDLSAQRRAPTGRYDPKAARNPSLLITQNLPTTTVRPRRVVFVLCRSRSSPCLVRHSLVSSHPTPVFAVTAAAFPPSLLLPCRRVRFGWLLQRACSANLPASNNGTLSANPAELNTVYIYILAMLRMRQRTENLE
ncbi:hypothetical protein PIB30_098941 [Stylosanthes scabra]|uniref:Uncharacterized protein n=1 Tax=Stylosanthes scabra TaxID=79078 RepID=A0ABU6UXH8_9FABA|nr:hypothetical protein [Stylosanthes scabra]